MRYSTAGAILTCVALSTAFQNTSPYLLLSTAEFPTRQDDASKRQLQTSADVLQLTKQYLASCPTDAYVIASQPGLNTVDIIKSKSIPHLRKAISNQRNLKYKHGISEVLGKLNLEELQDFIMGACGAGLYNIDTSRVVEIPEEKPLVVRVDFEPLPGKSSERQTSLLENDYVFQSILDALPSKNYSVIYATIPGSVQDMHNSQAYEPDFIESLHMELKRQSNYNSARSNDTTLDRRPLFEKYQFLTPGLFMTLLVSFLLLSILSVGLRALLSLQVSYGAFDKEMGPAAQKKQQ